MSLDFLTQIIEEIALEGLDGATLSTLWTRLEQRKGFQLAVDDKSKLYLWKSFAGHVDLQFYEMQDPRPPLVYVNRFDFIDPDTGFWIDTDLGPNIYPLKMITGEDVQGSCEAFLTRKDVTDDVREGEWKVKLSLEDAIERWGDRLVVVASQALRSTTLLGTEAKSTLRIDDIEYCLLERIARSRYNGEVTTHSEVTGSLGVFKIESKKLFYHCKKLVKLKLITKQAFCIRDEKGKQLNCRLMHLRRYFSRIMSKTRMLLETVCKYLESKENHSEVTTIVREDFDLPEVAFKRLIKDKSFFVVQDVPYRQFYPDAPEEEFLTKSFLKERNLKVIKLVKPFKEEVDDDDDDEEDDRVADYAAVPWLYERPLLQQAMMHFEKAGAQGLMQTQLQSLMTLPRLECRTIVRNLLKCGVITSVMKSFGKQRTSILIATKFYNASKLSQEFDIEKSRLMEHMQGEILSADDSIAEVVTDMEKSQTEAIDVDTSASLKPDVTTISVSVVSTPEADATKTPPGKAVKRKAKHPKSGSPAAKSPKSSISTPDGNLLDLKHLTALKLRRANKILDALKEAKVFESIPAIYKMLLMTEADEGCTERMDRKTMTQLINWLKANGKIKIIKSIVQQEDQVLELEFVCSPDVQPQDQIIKTFIDHAKMKNFGMKKKHGSKSSRGDPTLHLPPDLPESLRESIMKFREYRSKLKVEEMVYDPSAYMKYNFLPKVKRHKMVYEYLHYLLYGYAGHLVDQSDSTEASALSQDDESGDTGAKSDEQSHLSVHEQIEAMKEPPLYLDDLTWKRYLAPLRSNHGHGQGWFLMSDVLVLMPLVVYCKVVSLPYKIDGLIEMLDHPKKRFYPVVCLPPSIRQQVLFARRYTQSFHDSCYQLCLMGLLSFGPQVFKDKDKCFMFLQKKALLLDTRTSIIAYCKTTPELDVSFKEQYYTLNTDEDVHTYWCDLEVIALNSNLGYKGVLDNEDDTEPSFSLVDALTNVKFQEDPPIPYLPGDRRGASGFDSSLFLHLIRNWSRPGEVRRKKPDTHNELVKRRAAQRTRKKKTGVQERNEGGRLKFLSTSLSKRLPRLIPQQQLGMMGPFTEDNKPTMSKRTRGNRGGKGVKRKPLDKSADGAKKMKIPKLRTAFRISNKNRKIRTRKRPEDKIRKRTYDDIDRSALGLMIQERVTWTAREDTIILLCKTASLLLARHRRGMIVPWTVVRDILHDAVPESRDKSSPACQRRVAFGMKNPQTMMSVSIYLGEAHQDKELMEKYGYRPFKSVEKDIREIFKGCVQMLIDKFTSGDQEKIILPATLTELRENFNVKVAGPITTKEQPPEVLKEKNVYYYTLQNLIHSYISAQKDKQGRAYEMFRLFKQYPDELLAQVFNDMNKMGLITKVKKDNPNHIRKRQFVTAVAHKKLTQKYYYNFHSRFPANLFTQSYTMLDKIVQVYTEGVSDGVELGGETGDYLGGHVATICGLFAMKKLDFCLRIPEDILIVDKVGLVKDPVGRGKTQARSAPSQTSTARPHATVSTMVQSTSTSTSASTSTSTGTSSEPVVPESDMIVVEEVEVAADSSSPHSGPGPSTSFAADTVETMKRRNCRSLVIIEGEIGAGESLLSKVPSRNASRSLLSLARNRILSSVDTKSSNVQDHFVINSCDVKVSLHLASTVTPSADGRLTDRELEETKNLFLKPQKAKEMYRKHLQYFPFHLDLQEVWEELGMEYGTEDVVMIKKVYEAIHSSSSIGVRESAIKAEYKTICNISLVIMVLLEQKAILRVGVAKVRLVSLGNARPWLIHSYKNTKGRTSMLRSMDQEADRVSLDEFPDGEPQTRGDKYVCDAGTSTADLNQADDGSLLDQGTQTPLPEMPFALSSYEKVRLIARPWRKPEGHLNKWLLKFMLESVMLYIMSNPGVRNTAIYQKYTPYLQPVVVQELVEMLEDLNCLTRTCLTVKVKSSLFHNAKVERVASGSLDDDIVMYEAKMDCTFKLGQFVSSLT
ncbi:general transcription factor 3C polypeptide 1-like isoform X1 [Haliotis rufescens]|uniref:general transcription factor 3C polypeptide 1-like isoform X1 n=1 Tax=Haliotis rufescens TaxID=6454 RepID=UPI00201EBF32|nr:general transcription factor 3C polypeptide 1-like isoform X1 [Haliotis rufescens]